MAFASAALRMAEGSTGSLDRLQREAGLASSRLEVAREHMLLEGQRGSARLEQLRNLTVAVRVVCGAAAVIEVLRSGEPDAHDRERGVIVTYGTIRCWCDKFGKGFAHRVKAVRRKPGSTWPLDEMFVTLRGEAYLLWRAVGEHGAELDLLLQKRRNKATAF